MSKTTVLHVIDHFRIGGAQTLLMDLVEKTDSEKFRLVVCCLRGPTVMSGRINGKNVKVVFLRKGIYDPLTVLSLVGIIRGERADIIHAHLLASTFFGSLAALLTGKPLIIHAQCLFDQNRVLFRNLEIISVMIAARIIAVSEAVREDYVKTRKASPGKIVKIYNAVDVNRYRPAETPKTELEEEGIDVDGASGVVCAVGRLHEHKGFEHLLEAAVRVLDARPGTVFLIAGEGVLRGRLEELSERLSISDSVVFLGQRTNVVPVLSAADVVVLPSVVETFGIAVIEAMAMAKPVVGTRVGGIPEIIDDGRNGLLVPPMDSAALADAIIRLLSDRGLRLRMGAEGRRKVEAFFNIDSAVRRIEEVYGEVASA